MADPTVFTPMQAVRTGTVDDPVLRVASKVSKSATTIQLTAPGLVDSSGVGITGATIIGAKVIRGGSKNYVSNYYVPAGGVSVDGLTLTGVKALKPDGTEIDTADLTFATEIPQDSVVEVVVAPQTLNMLNQFILGQIASGGLSLKIGDETDSDVYFYAHNADANKPYLKYKASDNTWYQSTDGVAENPIPTSSGSEADATETVKGIIELATLAEQGAQTETGGTGANLVLQAKNTIKTPATYTPALLTGGTNAQSNFVLWAVVTDGSFRITIDGTPYNVDGISFVGDTSMADVATSIQAAIRTATGGLETVIWDTDHFIVSSADTTSSSAITVTETSTGTVGTDISGAGASDWMDCDTGNGVVTNAVLDQTQDEDKIPVLGGNGKLAFLLQNIIEEAYSAGWSAKNEEAPTKKDVYDKIQSIAGNDPVYLSSQAYSASTGTGTFPGSITMGTFSVPAGAKIAIIQVQNGGADRGTLIVSSSGITVASFGAFTFYVQASWSGGSLALTAYWTVNIGTYSPTATAYFYENL